MVLTKRDIEILKFINDFGFSQMPQLEKRFQLRSPRSYQIMQRLVQKGCVQHERVFHNQPGIYRLTKKGASYTSLRPMDKIPIGNYEHQVLITELSIAMRTQHPTAQWVSERHLKHAKYSKGVGQSGHLPDAILVKEGGKQVAIEVELSLKAKERTQEIFTQYSGNFDFEEVWYFCYPDILGSLLEWSKPHPVIRIFNLKDVLT